jgi:hypothetical protein
MKISGLPSRASRLLTTPEPGTKSTVACLSETRPSGTFETGFGEEPVGKINVCKER